MKFPAVIAWDGSTWTRAFVASPKRTWISRFVGVAPAVVVAPMVTCSSPGAPGTARTDTFGRGLQADGGGVGDAIGEDVGTGEVVGDGVGVGDDGVGDVGVGDVGVGVVGAGVEGAVGEEDSPPTAATAFMRP